MIIRKAENPRGWTTLPNTVHENGELSLKARGLLGFLLSRPDNWEFDSVRMANSKYSKKDGRESIRTGLKELQKAGYLIRTKSQGPDGRWSTVTLIHDTPQEILVIDPFELDDPAAPPVSVDSPVDNPVEELGTTRPPRTGFPASVPPALLTSNNNHKNSSAQVTTDVVPVETPESLESPSGLLKKDPARGGADRPEPAGAVSTSSRSALSEKAGELPLATSDRDAIAAAAILEPRIQMFALRAHLVAALLRPVDFSEAFLLLAEAQGIAHQLDHAVAIADVVALALAGDPTAKARADSVATERRGLSPASLQDRSAV